MSRLTQDTAKPHARIRVLDSHPLWPSFQRVPLPSFQLARSPTTPFMPKHQRFGLLRVRSPLLAQSLLFSLPMGTKMFQFPTFAHLSMWPAFNRSGFPIRISRDQGLFAPTPGFSQLITSFVASESQGIHRLPFSYFFAFRLTQNMIESSIDYAISHVFNLIPAPD